MLYLEKVKNQMQQKPCPQCGTPLASHNGQTMCLMCGYREGQPAAPGTPANDSDLPHYRFHVGNSAGEESHLPRPDYFTGPASQTIRTAQTTRVHPSVPKPTVQPTSAPAPNPVAAPSIARAASPPVQAPSSPADSSKLALPGAAAPAPVKSSSTAPGSDAETYAMARSAYRGGANSSDFASSSKLKLAIIAGGVLAFVLLSVLGYSQVNASLALSKAKKEVKNGQYADAAALLNKTNTAFVLPQISQQLKNLLGMARTWDQDAKYQSQAKDLASQGQNKEALALLLQIGHDYPKYNEVADQTRALTAGLSESDVASATSEVQQSTDQGNGGSIASLEPLAGSGNSSADNSGGGSSSVNAPSVPSAPVAVSVPVPRPVHAPAPAPVKVPLYVAGWSNGSTDYDHFYSTNASAAARGVEPYTGMGGFSVSYVSAIVYASNQNQPAGSVPLYGEVIQLNNTHYYTTDLSTYNTVIKAYGARGEGVIAYVIPYRGGCPAGTRPWWGMFNPHVTDWFYTPDLNVKNALYAGGWNTGVAAFACVF